MEMDGLMGMKEFQRPAHTHTHTHAGQNTHAVLHVHITQIGRVIHPGFQTVEQGVQRVVCGGVVSRLGGGLDHG